MGQEMTWLLQLRVSVGVEAMFDEAHTKTAGLFPQLANYRR